MSLSELSLVAAVALLLAAGWVFLEVGRRELQIWLPAHIKQRMTARKGADARRPTDVFFCIVDHFEPRDPHWGLSRLDEERARVDEWCRGFPDIARRHRDTQGRSPQHTFFFPAEDYYAEHLDRLAALCRQGHGDVEIHLHHDNDTADTLTETLSAFRDTLHRQHGLLRADPDTGLIRYGFIHGNWALDNSGK
ncbi:MAG: hypothetical protein AB1515_00360, partial [Nitrospirota bacterium]